MADCPLSVLLLAALVDAADARGGGVRPPKRFNHAAFQPNTNRPPYWLIIPFVLLVVGFLVAMIWLIVAEERTDKKKRDDDKKASSLKFGRMDPRYSKD
jgi:hypothetical protein